MNRESSHPDHDLVVAWRLRGRLGETQRRQMNVPHVKACCCPKTPDATMKHLRWDVVSRRSCPFGDEEVAEPRVRRAWPKQELIVVVAFAVEVGSRVQSVREGWWKACPDA